MKNISKSYLSKKINKLNKKIHRAEDQNDENKRLLKINLKEPASNLFKYEPYKWENLYQSVIRNIIIIFETI